MLRKRTRSLQKDQQMDPLTMSDSGSESSYTQSDRMGYNHKTNSFFSVPGLYVGLSPKGMSDCDSVRSPTSPLDFRLFSNLGNPSFYRSPRSSQNGHQKSWDCSKLGLSIVNSLDGDDDNAAKESGEVLKSSESKNILFGQKVRIKTPNFEVNANSFEAPKSLPRNFAIFPHTNTKSPLQKDSSDVIFEIGGAACEPENFGKIRSCSLDSCKSFSMLSGLANWNSNVDCGNIPMNNVATRMNSPLQFSGGSPKSNNSLPMDLNLPPAGSVSGFVGSLSASEIELSEDYTCVISHGPNPKKTHIYGDCILECYSNEGKEIGMPPVITNTTIPIPLPSIDFLSFCYHCNKKLDGGKDIYIYRGEKAFCSLNCRSEEIMMDEEIEKAINKSSDELPKSSNGEELYENGIFDAP